MRIKTERFKAGAGEIVLELRGEVIMEVIRQTGNVPFEKTAVALGNFDGLHTAHMTIMRSCREYAHSRGLAAGVLLFSEHTLKVIANADVKILTPERQKLKILEESGMDFVYIRDFDKEFMQLEPEEFVKRLVSVLNASAVCVGYDYRFGHKAKGDTGLLKQLGKKYGFDVIVISEIDFEGKAVKSTFIRQLIKEGNVEHAAALLGRPFMLEGAVAEGFRNGTKMGIPTANLDYDSNMILPLNGVYAGYTYVEGKKYKSVINVGNNPTFNADKITVESHILDFDGDIYGKVVKVEFIKRLRGEIKFDGVEALVKQIRADIEQAGKDLI